MLVPVLWVGSCLQSDAASWTELLVSAWLWGRPRPRTAAVGATAVLVLMVPWVGSCLQTGAVGEAAVLVPVLWVGSCPQTEAASWTEVLAFGWL